MSILGGFGNPTEQIMSRCHTLSQVVRDKVLRNHRRSCWYYIHRENGGTLGMVPLTINPIYTLYSGYLLGIPPSKGLLGGVKQLGYQHFPHDI